MKTIRFPLGLLIAIVMVAGVVGLFSSHTSAQQTRAIHLAQGWNLVTWTGEKQPASAALASLGDAVSVAYGYNNDSQSFTLHAVGRPEISTLTDFEPEQSYWVLALRSAEWSVPGPAVPSCPTTTSCPAVTPCPYCPSASGSLGESCAGAKVTIQVYEVLLDIAEKGRLVGMTESEVRADLAQAQGLFDEVCQGVPLAEPSLLVSSCELAGRWKGLEEGHMLYEPDAQTGVWVNQFDSIIDEYCTP
jgi:hypothetical protein